MAGQLDLFMLEKQVGSEFTNRLRSNLRSVIGSTTKKRSGLALKSTVNAVYKNEQLYSLLIKTPYYIYPILHVGFEGSKKEGISKRIEGKNIITKAVEEGRLVQDLADKVGDLRAKEILSRITVAFDVNFKSSNSLNNE